LSAVELSIVIPVFDEEAILHAAVVDLRERLAPLGWRWELLLAENGSTDATAQIAANLSQRYPEVNTFSINHANYGAALREGIRRARGELVICEEIDLCDTDFHQQAVKALRLGDADMVIGSKLLPGARDQRPLTRHVASIVYNRLLGSLLDFRGTDTHGIKAFRRVVVAPIAEACIVDKDVFSSELVIRAIRAGVVVKEIPVRVLEKRTPSINLLRRVPNVVQNLAKLTWAIRFRS